MIDIQRILLRIKLMSNYLKRLKEFKQITLEEYLNNFDLQLISARILEILIQTAIDINKHLITKQLNIEYFSARESFLILKDAKILSENLAENLAKSVGFRNILAHEYLEIDYSTLFEIIPLALEQYPLYIKEIKEYLEPLYLN